MSLLEDFLKVAREEADLTQLELSKKLGFTSPQFVSNWERGICQVPTQVLSKLIKILKLDIHVVIDMRMIDNRAYLLKALRVRL